jgi:glucose/arabinose dehydrogenase
MFTRILALAILVTFSFSQVRSQVLPAGFNLSDIGSGWVEPVGSAFNSTGSKMFVWEKRGRVYVCNWDEGSGTYIKQTTALLNIGAEVGNWRDFGMLGFALDPNFDVNGLIYVLYVVDRHHLITGGLASNGYNSATNTYFAATIGRLTRYQTAVSSGNLLAIPGSRTILLGETRSTGIPILHESHGVGSLAFAADGTLLVSTGDGASYDGVDAGSAAGTYWSQALTDGIIRNEGGLQQENVGAFRSQMLNSHSGKILRIDPASGNGVGSNPFYDAAFPRSPKSRVWAFGLRNPFRMTIRPNTGSTNPATGDIGEIYVCDVGWSDIEEFTVITKPGMNLGWPFYEGLRTNTQYNSLTTQNKDEPNPLFGTGGCTSQYFTFRQLIKQATADNLFTVYNPCDPAVPIVSGDSIRHFHRLPSIDWNHTSASTRVPIFNTNNFTSTQIGTVASGVTGTPFSGICASAGCWYIGEAYPPQYVNTFFAGDLSGSWVKNFTMQYTDQVQKVNNFTTGFGGVVHISYNPRDQYLYITDMGGSTIRRLSYGGNLPPVSILSSNVKYGPSTLAVNFTGDASYDPDGTSVTYSWNFGDGTPNSTSANPTHNFTTPDSGPKKYVVKLSVTDEAGATTADSLVISVNNTPPNVSIISPVDNSLYTPGGDTLYTLEAVVNDAEHAAPQLSYVWQTVLRHNTHEHHEPIDTDPVTSTVITRIGCNGDSYHWFIQLTVTDAAGLSTVDSASIFPYCGPPLPVKLTSFSVAAQGNDNVLSWLTTDEVSLLKFEVERSYDGRTFDKIGSVNARPAGGSNNYNFTDDNFLDGYIYYRLRMVDADGKFAYSFIVRVLRGSKANAELTISPNPFKSEFLFGADFKNAGMVNMRIIDSKGAVARTIRQQVSEGFNSFQVDKLETLPKGVYFLEVIQGDDVRKAKIIKD